MDSFGQFIWDSESAGNKHPKRSITSLAVLDRNFINEIGQYRVCFGHFRTTSKKPNRGKVRVTVEVIRSNGESTTIDDLAGKVLDGFATSCGPILLLDLEVGDIVVWRYRFRKMPRLKDAAGFALVIFEGFISSPFAPPIPASAEQ